MKLTPSSRRLAPALLAVAVISGLAAGSAEALPSFARKYKVECSNCHSAMPYLNATGRAFQEAGYRLLDSHGKPDPQMESLERISDSLIWEKYIPLGGRFKGYLFNKVKGADWQLRPAHEIELFAAGNMWDQASFFVEVEGEDEDGFQVGVSGHFGWHPFRAANLVMGFGPILATDPYNSLRNDRRLTATHKAPLDYGSNLNARFRDDASFANFYGRVGKLFYEASFSGGINNDEGENPRDYLGRLAFDFTPGIMLGGLYFDATRDRPTDQVHIQRFGGDFNLEIGDVNAMGVYLSSKEKPTGAASQTNDSAYVELFYTFRKGERPLFVPLVRYDWRESNDGRDQLGVLVGMINAYLVQNVRVGLEYSAELKTPGDRAKSNRLVLLADVNF